MNEEILRVAYNRYQIELGKSLEPRAVLFDMDGVLYNSMPAHERSWLETAQRYGLPMTQEDVYMFEGQTGGQTIGILMQRKAGRQPRPEETAEIYACKTELFNRYNTGELVPNVSSVVEFVAPLKRVLVTGSSQSSLLDKLNEDFPNVFNRSSMVTGLDVERGKPYPEPYLRGLALAEVEPWQAIAIENAPSGIRSAVTAGCFVIGVNTGPLDDEVLWKAGAHLVLPDMKILLEVLQSMLTHL